MSKIFLGFILLFISTSAISGQLEDLANRYLSAYKENNLLKASKTLHCPESYSKSMLETEHKSIAKTLAIYIEEFGELENYIISNTNLYVTATTGCGTTEYWNKNKPITQLVYETKHKNNKIGYIVFSYSKIKGNFVIAFSNHGLPTLEEGSINKIKHVLNRIKNKNI